MNLSISYWSLIWTLRVGLRTFTRFRTEGAENVPSKGAYVLISNHISHFDPFIISAASSRTIDWMGSDFLFNNFLIRLYFQSLNVIKVRQYSADHGALREAIRRIQLDRGVGIFPEGGIRAGDWSLLGHSAKLYDGAFMVAVLGQVPIIPCLILGSDRFYQPSNIWNRSPIWVCFAPPIQTTGKKRSDLEMIKHQTQTDICKMKDLLLKSDKIITDDLPQTPQQRNPRLIQKQ